MKWRGIAVSILAAVAPLLIAPPPAEASERVDTILRQSPRVERTGADTLIWRIAFTAPMRHLHPSGNLDPTDFDVSGTTAKLTLRPVAVDNGGCARVWDAILSGGDLATLNGRVSIIPSAARYVYDCKGGGERMVHTNPLVKRTNHNWFVVQNAGGTVAAGPEITVQAHNDRVDEGQDAVFTVSTDRAPARPLTVHFVVSESRGSDMVAASDEGARTVTLAAGARSATYRVPTVDDDADDDTFSTVGIALLARPGYRVGTPASAAVDAFDDDRAPRRIGFPSVSFATGASRVEEGSGARKVEVYITPRPSVPLSVRYALSGSARQGSDYVIDGVTGGVGTLSVPAGALAATIDVVVLDDGASEDVERLVLSLLGKPSYSVGSAATHYFNIVDDDATPSASVPAAPVNSRATLENGRIRLVWDHPNDPAITGYDFRARNVPGPGWRPDWTAIPGANAHTTTFETANVPAGAVIELQLRARSAGGSGQAAAVVVRKTPEPIVDPPDLQPSIAVVAGARVTEGAAAVFTLTATPPPAAELTVNVTVSEEPGSDFVAAGAAGSRQVTIPVSGSARLRVATENDSADEPDGAVTVAIDSGNGYTVSPVASEASVAVSDNDRRSTATAPIARCASQLPADAVSVAELERWRDDPRHRSHAEHVDRWSRALAALDPSAGRGAPMTASEAQTYARRGWPRWVRATETIDAIERCLGDTTPPPPPPQLPEVIVTAAAGAVTEGTAAVFTLSATPSPTTPLTVNVTVSEGAGRDFVAAGDEGARRVTLPVDGAVTLRIATLDDSVAEPDGHIIVALGAGAGYTVGAARSATLAVMDDDGDDKIIDDDGGDDDGGDDEDGGSEGADELTVSFVDDFLEAFEQGVFAYRVTLSEPAPHEVRVGWRIELGTATDRDFLHLGGQLRFSAGELVKTLYLYPRDDSFDEGRETFRVVLSGAPGAVIGDGEARGVIVNTDPLPAAWLARFGRAVAEAALGGIADRMAASRAPGMQGSLGGQAIAFNPWAADTPAPERPGRRTTGDAPDATLAMADIVRHFDDGRSVAFGGTGHRIDDDFGATPPHTLTGRELLLGSRFALTGERDASGGSLALWGRAAQAGFEGEERDGGTTVGLDGEATTAMLGADYARGTWLMGLALAQTSAEGGWRDVDPAPPPPLASAPSSMSGKVETSLTAAIPYASLQVSERLTLWGAAGFGTGEMTLTPAGGAAMTTDTDWRMAALGLRSDLLAPSPEGAGGPALALVSDALWASTGSQMTKGLAASDSDVTRLRLGLEGSWRVALEGGGTFAPKIEAGMRHDGGDAETGFGVELGGGLAWADPNVGLTLDIEGRTLLAHEDGDLEDRGVSAQLAYRADPTTERGPSFSLRQEMGSRATGGLDALFADDPLDTRTGSEAESRWTMEAAYGFAALGGRFTGSPHVGVGLATGARDLSLGWRLAPAANVPGLSFGVKATRRESDGAEPEQTLGFEVRARW